MQVKRSGPYNEGMAIIQVKGCRCERCEHKWVPRDEAESPRVCPKCKSAYWNVPRRNRKTVDVKEAA